MDHIPVSSPSIEAEDIRAVTETMRAGWISSEGPQVQEFEQKFAALVGRRHGVAVANGTAAIDIALESLNLGPGDEVILPSFTIISCLGHVLRSGATPVFVDAELDSWNMEASVVEGLITSNTKAIIVVHIYGLPADIDHIVAVANKRGIPVIEDAAEAHGQQLNQRPLGSFGDISTFSFYSNKLVTTGEGGMVLTNDDALAEKFRELRNLSFNPTQRFVHENLGWNYRMTAMQAALGVSQLSRIEELLENKRAIGRTYQELLTRTDGLTLPLESHRGSSNAYWVFGVVLSEDHHLTAKQAMDELRRLGIGTRPFFYPLHRQPVLARYGFQSQAPLPTSEWLGDKGFYLPNGAGLSRAQQVRVVEGLDAVLAS